jgi:hypothetical protein
MTKSMMRSRSQLASAYAPESFFTFEGGLGACISKTVQTRKDDLDADTREQIAARMDEIVRSWHAAARSCRDASEPLILPQQCLERPLLDDQGEVAPFNEDQFVYLIPEDIGYSPAPLTFVCKTCRLVRTYEGLDDLDKDLPVLENPARCPHPKGRQGRCDWRQLDVLFVHWSGNWERFMPHQWNWDVNTKRTVLRRAQCGCGSDNFVLDASSPAIGNWFFRCAKCNRPLTDKPLQNDRDTLEMLADRDLMNYKQAHMEVTSYRASAVHYTQADQFINFKDDRKQRLRLLLPGNETALADFVAQEYGFERQPLTESELESAVRGAKLDGEWDNYQAQVIAIADLERLVANTPSLAATLKGPLAAAKLARDAMRADWSSRGIVQPRVDLPAEIREAIRRRASIFATRYDPFRLAAEHAALRDTKLLPAGPASGRRPFVPFDRLDKDLAPDLSNEAERLQRDTRQYLDQLGIETMGLIREFDLCRFSFGYSRVSAAPVLRDKRGLNMPVRLKLFPPIFVDDRMKYPVYVIRQANEAIYVKLSEQAVYEWLGTLACERPIVRSPDPAWRLGAGLLQLAEEHAMDRYLAKLHKGRGSAYYYTYTLLHTYAHVIMKQISEFSGLDVGSLGEYLFPTDLAFVVYRSGATMDLGNLSALWRNSNTSFLRSLLRTKTLECGSGSLCVHRGGACPDCVMVPETSCVAGNNLLSRSVLRGSGRPRLDDRTGSITGFLDSVNRHIES